MFQAEVNIDLDAIQGNVAHLRAGTTAQVMAVVKADGYGHGMIPSARAALLGGATWLGVSTLDEALRLRESRVSAPVLAWLWTASAPALTARAVAEDIDLSVSTRTHLDVVSSAARLASRPARVHLKVDTGLSRGGATLGDWPALVEAAAKAQANGQIEIVSCWSHFALADVPGHESIDSQLDLYTEALGIAQSLGVEPQLRHMSNSAAALTRPDAHFDLVRAGVAIYGLSPIEGEGFGLRPAMTARATVVHTKQVPAGQGVSYGHTYVTSRPTGVALIPLGYGDGVPRHASNAGPVQIGDRRFTVAGRVCMDQFVVDIGDAPVREGDEAILFGPGDSGEPTADDWARAAGTINYEIVTRFGSARVPRTYRGEAA